MHALAEAGARLLGEALVGAEPLRGGDLAQVVRLGLASGRTAVAKSGPAPAAEAVMLAAIAATGAPAPAVLAVDDAVLVLEDLPHDGRAGPAVWRDLGTALRRVHSTHGGAYGWDRDYAFGPVGIANARCEGWPEFWAERRLLAGLETLPADLARRLEHLAGCLRDLLPAAPAAELLHGDLWAGNLLMSGCRLTGLIDPACYHGHGEVDLAMLHLFGAPGPEFRESYGVPEPGEAERRPVYQLWPALVHLRLFGAGYRGMVERLLGAAGV